MIFPLNSPNIYPAFISLRNVDRGNKVMTHKIGDKLSLWKMPLFIFTSPGASPSDVSSFFQFFIDFSITFPIVSATFKILSHCRIEVWGTMSRQHSSLSSLEVFHHHFINHELIFGSCTVFCSLYIYLSCNSFSRSVCP